MWDMIMDRLPSTLGWAGTGLAFLVPYIIYRLNEKYHEKVDPPWKQEEKK